MHCANPSRFFGLHTCGLARMAATLFAVCTACGSMAAQNLPSAPMPSPVAPVASAGSQPQASGTAPAASGPVLQSLPPVVKAAPAQGNASAATEQGTQPANEPDLYKITKAVNEVNLIFTVTDKHGHFVKNLKESDIRLLDDKMPPKQIDSFTQQTNLPLRVGLLIDASTSIRDRFKFEQEAAIEFLNQIVRPGSDKAFVLGFDTVSEVTQDMTGDTTALDRGVRMLRPGGGTALYDAVYYACREKLLKGSDGVPSRRAIILVSDGDDNYSRVTREEAIAMAQRAEVIIYAVSTNVSGVTSRGDHELQRMAEATGGRAFFPFKIQEVADAFSGIEEELRSQYAISYKPEDFVADGAYRTIEISATDKKYHVRARQGYFAPRPETTAQAR